MEPTKKPLPKIVVDVMEGEAHKVLSSQVVNGWRTARRLGYTLLKESLDKGFYIRLHDLKDASNVDFIIRRHLEVGSKAFAAAERSKKDGKRKGIKYSTNTDC